MYIDNQFNVLMKGPATQAHQMSLIRCLIHLIIQILQAVNKIELAKDTINWFLKISKIMKATIVPKAQFVVEKGDKLLLTATQKLKKAIK